MFIDKKTLGSCSWGSLPAIGARLSSVSFDSFVSLRFSAPFSFLLRFYESSAIVMLRAVFCSVLVYVSVKGRIVYLVLLKSHNVLVQLFLGLRVGCLVIGVRVGEISSVKLKVRRVVDQELLRRS